MEGSGGGDGSVSRRSSVSLTRRRTENGGAAADTLRRTSISRPSAGVTGERTVKRLRLSKALTIPESTTILEACRRMAVRRVDAVLLTDSNALLCGIITDKDITTRVIAKELKLDETPVSKVMTRNPVFVLSDTLAVEALQKMVLGKFRHLPVVENGEVIALLDIAKCLYDAIARMERAAEKGKAIAAAVEGVEKHWRTSISGPNSFIETLRDRMFKPSLSTIIPENSKVVTLSPSDSVLTASKKMLEFKISSAVVIVDGKPRGILTPRDILMRVIAQNLSPESTPVEKVMTTNPECGTVDMPILDALHTMHDGKFLHLPVVDRDGNIVTVLDVIHITHASVATVGTSVGTGTGTGSDGGSAMMQKFWDSAMDIGPDDDSDNRSEGSTRVTSEMNEAGRSALFPSGLSSTFGFKIQDKKGRMHRFNCEINSLTDLIASILPRVGDDIDRSNLPQILYEDEDHDKVILASDSDLTAAVDHARQIGWKSLRLYLDYSGSGRRKGSTSAPGTDNFDYAQKNAWAAAYSAVAAGAALVAGLGVMAYLKRAGS
ncbi:CBS domain-containing protein CBSCBSPB1-like isoform X1 [Carex littledalei]|uniref:CBS domain-containing protein CBSCBSPB1-like isoform X1 n=1 Tax=Carex littledalei TaxID=544730 RepID=A0A833RMK3_9POAL|nr:CBS domain-containing protein CBSCBSPB1-like isoform X1 [Carex littledalei]